MTNNRKDNMKIEKCYYCGGNCPNESKDSEFLCDSYAGDIDDLYKNEQATSKRAERII